MVTLTRSERDLLMRGVAQWGGPAYPSEALAIALHRESLDDLYDESERLGDKLQGSEPLTDEEIIFALVSTELNFASDRWGAGYEWETVSGYSDVETIALLRKLQVKLVAVGARPW